MVTEISLVLPLVLMYKFDIISGKAIVAILVFIYWLPKSIVIRLLNTLYPQVITHTKHNRYIALTFDDAPYGYHDKIIQIADKHHQKVTLFVISNEVNDDNIGTFVRAVKNGHQLGNHGRTNSMHFLKSIPDLVAEIEHCDQMIRSIYQKANVPCPKQMIYRPGCGLFGPEMLSLVESHGYKLALGSVYPNDPMVMSSTINYCYLVGHIEAGDVVIMHDRKWTSDMLEPLFVWLEEHNLESVTLEKLFRPEN